MLSVLRQTIEAFAAWPGDISPRLEHFRRVVREGIQKFVLIVIVLIVIVPLLIPLNPQSERTRKESGTIHSLFKGTRSCPSAFTSCSRRPASTPALPRLLLTSPLLPLNTLLKEPARSPARRLAPTRRRMSSTARDSPAGLAPATTLTLELLEAAHFAAVAHSQQRRKSAARPAYIQHPIHVALLLASPESSLYPDPPVEILQAAVLHDTIEDTDVTAQDLEQKFGKEVTKIGKPGGLLSSHPRGNSCAVFISSQYSNARTTRTWTRHSGNKRRSTRRRTNQTQRVRQRRTRLNPSGPRH